MTPGRMRDMAAEYEQAAELFAHRYGNGLIFNGAFFGTGVIDLPPARALVGGGGGEHLADLGPALGGDRVQPGLANPLGALQDGQVIPAHRDRFNDAFAVQDQRDVGGRANQLGQFVSRELGKFHFKCQRKGR